jgi:hypothetical protein
LACLVAMLGHGWLAVGLLALLVGAEAPVVVSVEQSLAGSLVEEPRLGTAYGVMNGINGFGDLGSSVLAGLLWMASPAAALGFGAGLSGLAAGILWLRPPNPSN